MKMRGMGALILSATVLASAANAEFVDGRRLTVACNATDKTFVEAFVAGVADKNSQDISAAMDFAMIATDIPRERLPVLMSVIGRYCPPANVTVQQMVGVVCSYVKDNADQSSQAAAKLAVQALKQSYPCQPLR